MKLEEIAQKARDNHVPVMLDDTSCYLANFCYEKKPKNILEIGTAVGYSGLVMLLGSGDDSMLTTIEINEKLFLKAKHNFQAYDIEPRTKQYLGDAAEILPWLDEKYDLIFLDGPKGQYLKYFPTLFKLLKVGGYLIADNIYYHGMVKGDAYPPHKHRTIVTNLRAFNSALASDERLECKFEEIGDGILIAKKLCD